MKESLGERYTRGEFEICSIDGHQVERQIRHLSYGFRFVEYRDLDGQPSHWGVWFPQWPHEMRMTANQADMLRHKLNRYLDPDYFMKQSH